MLGLYDVFAAREARLSPPANPLAAAEGPRLPPQPRLQVHPVKDLRELREAERDDPRSLRLGRQERRRRAHPDPARHRPARRAARQRQRNDHGPTDSSPRRRGGAEIACSQVASASLRLCGEKWGWAGGRCDVLALQVRWCGPIRSRRSGSRRRRSRRCCAASASISASINRCRSTSSSATRPGADVTLGSLFRGKPVILNLVYYECPMLCTLVLNGLLSAMKALPFDAGKEFDVITVSFNPTETPAARRAEEGDVPRAVPAPRRRARLALPHRRRRRRSSGSRRRSASATATTRSATSSPTPPASPC